MSENHLKDNFPQHLDEIILLLIDYLNTVSLDELNKLWESNIWEDPVNIPFAEKLEEYFIKESVRKVRSIKWKLKNK